RYHCARLGRRPRLRIARAPRDENRSDHRVGGIGKGLRAEEPCRAAFRYNPPHMLAHLLAELPDSPRWLETRAILRSPHVTMYGGEDGYVVRLVHGAISVVAIVGRPSVDAIASAIEGITSMTPILAQSDNADHVERSLPAPANSGQPAESWTRERVILHRLTSSPALARAAVDQTFEIRLLTRGDDLDHLPPGLRHEIRHAREMAPIAA